MLERQLNVQLFLRNPIFPAPMSGSLQPPLSQAPRNTMFWLLCVLYIRGTHSYIHITKNNKTILKIFSEVSIYRSTKITLYTFANKGHNLETFLLIILFYYSFLKIGSHPVMYRGDLRSWPYCIFFPTARIAGLHQHSPQALSFSESPWVLSHIKKKE